MKDGEDFAINGGPRPFRPTASWIKPWIQREDLTQAYVERLVDGMGERELIRYATDSLLEQFDRYSDVHLEEEVMKFHPDLLDDPWAILAEEK